MMHIRPARRLGVSCLLSSAQVPSQRCRGGGKVVGKLLHCLAVVVSHCNGVQRLDVGQDPTNLRAAEKQPVI